MFLIHTLTLTHMLLTHTLTHTLTLTHAHTSDTHAHSHTHTHTHSRHTHRLSHVFPTHTLTHTRAPIHAQRVLLAAVRPEMKRTRLPSLTALVTALVFANPYTERADENLRRGGSLLQDRGQQPTEGTHVIQSHSPAPSQQNYRNTGSLGVGC